MRKYAYVRCVRVCACIHTHIHLFICVVQNNLLRFRFILPLDLVLHFILMRSVTVPISLKGIFYCSAVRVWISVSFFFLHITYNTRDFCFCFCCHYGYRHFFLVAAFHASITSGHCVTAWPSFISTDQSVWCTDSPWQLSSIELRPS